MWAENSNLVTLFRAQDSTTMLRLPVSLSADRVEAPIGARKGMMSLFAKMPGVALPLLQFKR